MEDFIKRPKGNRIEVSAGTAAKMLTVKKMTVLRYLEEGRLDGYQRRERGWWRVYLDSVEAMINERQNGAQNGSR
jgi:excisionase family DNA binding protein